MDDYLKKQTLDRLSKAPSILIAIAQNSNIDGLAAGLALYLSLKKMGKAANVFAKDPTVGEARQLYAIDKVGSTGDEKDLVITIDNAIKNVDKVTYFLEKDKLKIVVHSLLNSPGISTDDISIGKTASKPELIFAIGFDSASQVKQEVTHEQNIDSNIWLVNISIGDMIQKFAQAHVHEQSLASLSELTAKLMQDLSLPLDEDISFNLYSGIKSATNSFSPQLTSQATLVVAQYLLKFGAGKAGLAGDESRRAALTKELGDQTEKDNLKIDFKIDPADVSKIPNQSNITGIGQKPVTRPNTPDSPLYDELVETPIERVEAKENLKESWLKPPKIYRGSKSFDRES